MIRFWGKPKKLSFDDLPGQVQEQLEMVELIAMEGGDPKETFQQVSKRYPGYIPARLNLAASHLNDGEVLKAKSVYEAISKHFPEEPGVKAGLATVLQAEGRYEQAAELASASIAAGYEWPACFEVLAVAKKEKGDLAGAAQHYLDGYRRSPHSWNYLEEYCQLKGRPFTSPLEEVEPCISLDQLQDLASFVDRRANTADETGGIPGCDHTLRFAEEWAKDNGVDIIELYQFLNGHGGFCDCETCFNVTELLADRDEAESDSG